MAVLLIRKLAGYEINRPSTLSVTPSMASASKRDNDDGMSGLKSPVADAEATVVAVAGSSGVGGEGDDDDDENVDEESDEVFSATVALSHRAVRDGTHMRAAAAATAAALAARSTAPDGNRAAKRAASNERGRRRARMR